VADLSLVLSSCAASVASGLFLAAGLNLLERRVGEAEARNALLLFAVWWIGVAVYALAGASQDLMAALGADPFAVFVALRYMQIIAICIGLWGLMYYLAYVLTGQRRLMAPLAAFYAAYYAVLLFLVTRGAPVGVDVQPWRTSLVFATPLMGAFAVALLLVIPPLVGGTTYLALLRQAPSVGHRLRIALVALATVAWSLSIVLRDGGIAAAVPLVLGLMSGLSISWAYAPPRWLAKHVETPA
jgi:hypothetical protein